MDPNIRISIRMSHVCILKYVYANLLQLFNQPICFQLLLFLTLRLFFHLKTVNRQIVLLLLSNMLNSVGFLLFFYTALGPIVFSKSFLLNTLITSMRLRKFEASSITYSTRFAGTIYILIIDLLCLSTHFFFYVLKYLEIIL